LHQIGNRHDQTGNEPAPRFAMAAQEDEDAHISAMGSAARVATTIISG
jgi:hypothetical protein